MTGTIISPEGASKGDPSEIRSEGGFGHFAVLSAEFPGFDSRMYLVAGEEPNPPEGYSLYTDRESAIQEAMRLEVERAEALLRAELGAEDIDWDAVVARCREMGMPQAEVVRDESGRVLGIAETPEAAARARLGEFKA